LDWWNESFALAKAANSSQLFLIAAKVVEP
jgi:hypothetical protein